MLQRPFRCHLPLIFCAMLLAAVPARTEAQPPDTATTAAPTSVEDGRPREETTGPKLDPDDSSTPRRSMENFLLAARDSDWARAAGHLDLRRLPKAERAERGPRLARQLKAVLDRELWIELDALSDDPAGAADDGLPSTRDTVGVIATGDKKAPIEMERVSGAGDASVWKISAATVAATPGLYNQFGPGIIGEILPPVFFDVSFLEVQLWQWAGLLAFCALAWLASWLVTFTLGRILGPLVRQSKTTIDDRLLDLTAGPLRLVLSVAIFVSLTRVIGPAVPVQRFLDQVGKVAVILALSWLLLRLVDVVSKNVEDKLVQRGQAGTAAILPLGRRGAKAVVLAFATLAALQNFGFHVTGILAGLGIGGLAVALAAQKTLENLFGGLTIIADQPVRVGDFCRFSGTIGTVEDIGLRSTRIRTLERTVVSVPNSEFSNMQIENFTRRDRIWLHPILGIRYETTPDQLRFLLVELKKMLVAHPRVSPEPARVRFVEFGDYSLNLEIFAYVRTSDFDEFLSIKEDIYLRIMDIVARSGTGFAFPSQTLYMSSDSGLPDDRVAAAEASVRSWREAKSMPLPWMPLPVQRELAGTLDFPPEGSASDGRKPA